jgi:transcriptional regulator with XRE-family HTH domain
MPNAFAETLRHRREELGMTQANVARRSGVTPEAIHLFETGKRFPDLDRVPRLAAVLQLDEAALCRLALENTAPVFYSALVEEEVPAGEVAGSDPKDRVVVETDREGAHLVRVIQLLDSQTRHHLSELATELASANGRR